jgi:hypothetical protein
VVLVVVFRSSLFRSSGAPGPGRLRGARFSARVVQRHRLAFTTVQHGATNHRDVLDAPSALAADGPICLRDQAQFFRATERVGPHINQSRHGADAESVHDISVDLDREEYEVNEGGRGVSRGRKPGRNPIRAMDPFFYPSRSS